MTKITKTNLVILELLIVWIPSDVSNLRPNPIHDTVLTSLRRHKTCPLPVLQIAKRWKLRSFSSIFSRHILSLHFLQISAFSHIIFASKNICLEISDFFSESLYFFHIIFLWEIACNKSLNYLRISILHFHTIWRQKYLTRNLWMISESLHHIFITFDDTNNLTWNLWIMSESLHFNASIFI